MMTAFVALTGAIGFTSNGKVPKGTLVIARSENHDVLRNYLSACSRHSYYDKRLLVPGIPESKDRETKLNKLRLFLKFINDHKPPEIEIATIVLVTRFTGKKKNVAKVQSRKPRPTSLGGVRKGRAR